MSLASYLARRTVFALFTIYLVVSVTFGVVALTPDTTQVNPEYDDPLHVRYVDWLADVTTLDFGYAPSMESPVSAVLWPGIQRTALYTVPAFALSILLGTTVGVFAGALRGRPDWAVRLAGYATVGVPVFVAAYVLLAPFESDVEWIRLLVWQHTPFDSFGNVVLPNHGLWPPSRPLRFLVPASLFALALTGWQLRYVRTAYLDRAGQEFVKLHRAKGAGWLRVARHVLRNAAVPIVSASLSELLVVVLLNIYVIETVFGIEGVAALNMIGVRQREMGLIIGTSLVLAVGGVLASYVQDVLYGYLNPRIRA